MNYLLVVQVFVRTPRWSILNWRRQPVRNYCEIWLMAVASNMEPNDSRSSIRSLSAPVVDLFSVSHAHALHFNRSTAYTCTGLPAGGSV